jgi:hypothetical protein
MHRNQLSKVAPLALLAAALLLAPDQANAGQYPGLCDAVSKACVLTGPDAPSLKVDVCWNRVTAKLKGVGDCPFGSWPYYVNSGEIIDPVLGIVLPYVALPDACGMGLCDTAPVLDTDELASIPLCCEDWPDNCVLQEVGQSCELTVFCPNGSTNDDGTITCHSTEG